MTALLYRGVPQKDLLDACYAEWSKSPHVDRRASRVEEQIRRHTDDPVEGYRAAAKILTEKT
jgi:hypothetical protein